MKDNNDKLVKVFSGTDVSIGFLKKHLEENGIASLTKNSFQSGNIAGFMGGTPSSIDLFIQEKDLKKAEPIIEDFKKDIQE